MNKKSKPIIGTRKMKGDGPIDFYDCRNCGKRWKQTDKRIGHTEVGCARYAKWLWWK
jgi:hypothetical protein